MKRFLLSIIFFVGVFNVGFGQTITTAQPGAWNDTNTWTGGIIPTNTNSSEIRLNHDVNIPAGYSAEVDQVFVSALVDLTVDIGGVFNLQSSGGTDLTLEEDFVLLFTGSNLIVNGDFINNSTTSLNLGSGLSTVSFNGNSTYEHAVDGLTIPSTSTSWSNTSTLRLTGVVTNLPGGLSQSFGNIIFNSPSLSGNKLLNLTATTINGNFEILDTNSPGVLTFASGGGNINIGGDLTVTGASRIIALNNAGTLNLNVDGDFNFSSTGILSLFTITNPSSIVNFRVKGDFNVVSGTIQAYAVSGPDVNIIFNGGTNQAVNINAGSLLPGQKYDYSIVSNSIVEAGETIFVGTGSFNLNAGSQLSTSRENTINSLGTGAVQVTGTKTYSSGSIIGLTGTNDQSIDQDNGFPTASDLQIDKTAGIANLVSDLIISTGRSLTLSEGSLNIGDGNLLTLNGNVVTTNGGISGGPLSDLAIGGTGTFGTLGFVGTQELRNFTINRTSSGTVSLGGDLTVLGDLTQTAGDLLLNGNQLTINSNYAQTAGTLISNSTSSLIVNGAGTLPASLSFLGDINAITLDRASATLNTGASGFTVTNLNLYSGIVEGTAIGIADAGVVERRASGSLTNVLIPAGTYDLLYNNSSLMTSGAELHPTAINDLTKTGTSTLTIASNFDVNGILTLSNGDFDAGANTISLNGDFVSNAASTLTSATVSFDGTTNLSGATAPTFGNITVNGVFNPTSNLNVNGDITNNGTLNSSGGLLTINAASQLQGSNPITVNNFTIGASGVVTANSAANLQINGDFTNNGSFDGNSGTVVFGGTTSISGTVPTFANVEIANGSTLNGPASLPVSGNFTNEGTFVNNDGTLDMIGSGTRSLGGASALALHNLTVSGGTVDNANTGGITISNGVTLGANTTLDADGSGSNQFTLLSTSPTTTAFVGQIPSTSSVSGNLNVQRHFSTGRFYRYTGSAVTSTSVEDWRQEFPITGTFDDPSTGNADGTTLNSSNPSLYYWDASTSVYVAYPTSGTAASNLIEVGRGYTPFIRNSISNIIGELTGVINQGTVSIPVAYDPNPPAEFGTDSWNLISNPYPAPIDWDAAGWTRTNIANEIHVPKTDGSFAVYDGTTGTNGGSQNIASGQGFWIRATGSSPAISVDETIKSTGQNPQFFRNEPLEEFRIKLTHKGLSDEIVLVMRDQASFGYDEALDASRRLNINGFGYTLSTSDVDGKKMKINSVPKVVESDCSVSIPINMESVTKTGDFNLSFSQVNNLLKYYKVDLIDNYENKVISLESDYQYSYQINTDAESKSVNRFSLVLNNKDITALPNLSDVEACASSEVTYALSDLDPLNKYIIYQGEEKLTELSNQSKASVGISANFLQNSVNNFDVYGQVGTCDSVKVGTFTINSVDSDINLDIKVSGSSICPKASIGNFELNTEDGVSYFILNGGDTLQHISGDGSIYNGTIDKSFLEVGPNTFAIAAEKNECAYGTLTQELEIVVDDFEINQDVLFTSSAACYKNSSFINFTSQSGVDYGIFKGSKLIKNVTGDGTDKKVEIPSSNLSVGFNEFTVVAKYGDCGEYQFPDTVEINVEENINKNLSLITENTCGDSNSIVIIENAQAGKQYSLKNGEENISSLTAMADGELAFTLNSNQVATGLNTLDIQIEGQSCGTQISSNQAVFTVEESVNGNLEYIAENSCGAENAVIGITNPQKGKVYQLYDGETLIESKEATVDADLIFDLVNEELRVGQNTFDVKIVSNVCGVKEASQSISFEVYESIDSDLTISSSDACAGANAVIDILNPQIGKTYRLMKSETAIATKLAESLETLSFSIPSDGLTSGNHVLSVDIIDDNCGTITAKQSVEFEVFSSAVIENIENQEICLNDNVQIDLVSNVPMSNYQLYIGQELVREEASSSLNLSPSETTTYTLTGKPESGCEVNTVSFTVEVTDLAKPGILVSGNLLESSVEGDQYQWYLNGEILEEETGKLIVASISGDYTVEVTKSSCSFVSDAFTFNEEVLNANRALENALNFYPNPVADKLFIELDNINSINITIFTISGKFIDKFEFESSQSEVDMHKFDKGTYLIQFNAGKASVTKRIVKL